MIVLMGTLLPSNSFHIILNTIGDSIGSLGRSVSITILLGRFNVIRSLLFVLLLFTLSLNCGFGVCNGFAGILVLLECGGLDGRNAPRFGVSS